MFDALRAQVGLATGGYPVIMFGHSLAENAFLSPALVASTFAQAGFATLAINVVGHGLGPQSVVQLSGVAAAVI